MHRFISHAFCLALGLALGLGIPTAMAVTDIDFTTLQKKVIEVEKRFTDSDASLDKRVTELERRMDNLESAIKVFNGSVTIQGTAIAIKASGELTLKGSKIVNN